MSDPAQPPTESSPGSLTESSPEPAPRPSLLGPRIFAGALLLVAAVVLVEAFRIREGSGFQALGPRAFPLAIGVGLLVLGVLLLLRTTLVPDDDLARQAGEEEAATHWTTVGLALAGLLGYALSLAPLGYIVATAAFVPIEARILGSRRPLRDLIAAAGVGTAVFFGFTRFLGVRLPEGLLDPLL